jgi:hypothetical protein
MASQPDPKKLTSRARIGELGVNIIQETVLDMGFAWIPNPTFDVGIDGTIELFDPDTGEAFHQLIRVQSKATSRRFSRDTPHSFQFRCRGRDINYWLRSPIPVILICSRVDTRVAYWVSVKDYFSVKSRLKSRLVVFDKTQRFDKSAAPALLKLATVEPTSSVKPPPRQCRCSTLTKSLLEARPTNQIDLSPHVYQALRGVRAVIARSVSDPTICCALRDFRVRCARQLNRLLAAHATLREELLIQNFKESARRHFSRLLKLQTEICEWAVQVERSLDQHLELLRMSPRRRGLLLLDELITQYAAIVLGHDERFAFLTLVDSVPTVQSSSVGAFRVPKRYAMEPAHYVAELWHEVGVRVFYLKFGFGDLDPSDVRFLADAFAALLLFRLVFRSQMRAFVSWLAWSILRISQDQAAPDVILADYIIQALAYAAIALEYETSRDVLGAPGLESHEIAIGVRVIAAFMAEISDEHLSFSEVAVASATHRLIATSKLRAIYFKDTGLLSQKHETHGKTLFNSYAKRQLQLSWVSLLKELLARPSRRLGV